jgi:hypothetical protein
MRMAANGTAAAKRSSVPKKQARRPRAAAAATNASAAAGACSGSAIGRAGSDPGGPRVEIGDGRVVAVEPVAEPRLEDLKRRRVPPVPPQQRQRARAIAVVGRWRPSHAGSPAVAGGAAAA